MRLRLTVVLGAVALLALAGCGGGGGGAKSEGVGAAGASIAPASAALILSFNTDFDSEQVNTLQGLLDKFPGQERLDASFRQALFKQDVDFDRDVKPALGPEIDVVLLDFANGGDDVVGVTRPKDRAKFNDLLAKMDDPPVHEEVEGFTVFADTQALIDRFKRERSGDSLADTKAYQEAMAELTGETLATLYVDGASVMEALKRENVDAVPGFGRVSWISGAAQAKSNGVGVEFHAKADDVAASSYTSELAGQVPSGVLAFLSFRNLKQALDPALGLPSVQKQLGAVEGVLGVSVQAITSLFTGEGAFYVRQGAPIPEVTLALQVPDEQRALATVDALAAKLAAFLGNGKLEATQVGGVAAKKVDFGNFAVYYAAFDGKLVVTSSATGITGLRSPGAQTFKDDPVFNEAKGAAGMPDETAGFLFVNLKDAVPLIENFAQVAGSPLPPVATENLSPLRSLLLYSTTDGSKFSLKGFLQIQ